MRIAVCAFSAVLLSGCSWFGGTSHSNSYSYGYGSGGSAYGGCGAGMYGGQQYGAQQYGAQQAAYGYGQASGQTAGGCGAVGAGGYGMGAGGGYAGQSYAGQSYAGQGYGGQGYTGQGFAGNANGAGLRGGHAMGANGYGPAGAGGGVYGASGYGATSTQNYGTVLGGAAPYGAAVGGTQIAGGHAVNGQWAAGGYAGGTTTTVQGSPIYVPQPYPAYYGVGYNAGYAGGYNYGYGGGMRGASAALPFGLEFGVGTEFGIDGDIATPKVAGPASGGAPPVLNLSDTPAISYADAYKNAVNYSIGATYDISPSTTLLANLGYSKAEGQNVQTGTVDDGALTEDLFAQWGDLEQFTVEGGVRQYMGGWNNGMTGLRPYVGASAGFTHNNDVSLTQSSATLMPVGANTQNYIQSGWNPTVAGVIGAEMQVGARTAIGIESGIRWRDDLSSIQQQSDRWSVPVKLRGRISF